MEKWIQKAVKKPGAFTRYCKQKGYSGVTKECIKEGLKSNNEKTRKRAVLARFFKKLAQERKNG